MWTNIRALDRFWGRCIATSFKLWDAWERSPTARCAIFPRLAPWVFTFSPARCPFPIIKIPVVVVATFYNGMPPEQIENDISGRFERFFTLGSGIDHIESRSLPGVSLIKVYFQPGTNPDSAVTTIANLASANLRRLPPGTLPPVVLKFDASSLPVCLITLKGEGMNAAELRDH